MTEDTNEAGRADASAPRGISGARFDHVGLALRRPTDLWPVLAGALGGRYVGRGNKVGYGWTQLRFANGFVIEGLHSEPAEDTDFLSRFLDRSGVGPHHLTFFLDDLDEALALLRAADIELFGERREDPDWLEVVIHPHDAFGIVVQLVQVGGTPDSTVGGTPDSTVGGTPDSAPEDPPEGFPELGFDHPVASLGRVVHAVADLDGALELFRDLLGGTVVSSGSAIDGNHWVELGWDGPGRLRLLEGAHAEIAEWIGDRPGRLRHLFFSFDEPSHVPAAHQVAPGRWVVDPDDVLGTRFVIASSAR